MLNLTPIYAPFTPTTNLKTLVNPYLKPPPYLSPTSHNKTMLKNRPGEPLSRAA